MSYRADVHLEYDEYCPWHEFDWLKCYACCIERRRELLRIENSVRHDWQYTGYSFRDRGRSNHPPCGGHGTTAVRGLESQYASAT